MSIRKEQTTGLTAELGFSVAASRVLSISEIDAWKALLTSKGTEIILGGEMEIAERARTTLPNGTTIEVRAIEPGSRIRLAWMPKGWSRPSMLQVRIAPAENGTVLEIRQEKLGDVSQRALMQRRWESVLDDFEKLVTPDDEG